MRTPSLTPEALSHNGKIEFRVNFGKNFGGRKWFPNLKKAQDAVRKHKADLRRIGELAGKLSQKQILDLLEAERIVAGLGITVSEAALVASDQIIKRTKTVTFLHAFEDYCKKLRNDYETKDTSSLRLLPRHRDAVEQTKLFFQVLHDAPMIDITKEDITNILAEETAPQFNKHLAHLRAMFNRAIRENWVNTNIIKLIERRPTPPSPSRAYKPEEVRKLMYTLVDNDFQSIPYYCLIFFAGLRPDAAFKLDWSDLNSGTQILIRKTISKGTRTFPVSIQPTLKCWLNWWKKKGGTAKGLIHPLSEKTRDRRRKKLINLSNIAWIQDAPRRTFGTCHFLKFKSAAHASAELGHIKGTDVFYDHYYDGTLTKQDAKKFWDILPP